MSARVMLIQNPPKHRSPVKASAVAWIRILRGLDYLDSLHPGFVMGYSSGGYRIMEIIPGSAANAAGLQIGDEVLRINGSDPGERPCGSQSWEALELPGKAIIRLRRNGREWNETISLSPSRSLLANLWLPAEGLVQGVSYHANSARYQRAERHGPYTTGIAVENRASHLLVLAVLRGSPAYLAGISTGDEIVRVDGTPIGRSTDESLSALWRSDRRVPFRLTLRRKGLTWTQWVVASGVTEILRRASTFAPPPAREADVAAANQ